MIYIYYYLSILICIFTCWTDFNMIQIILTSISSRYHPYPFQLIEGSDAYMHQYNASTLVQIMACRLFGLKPLSESMLPYHQLDTKEHVSVKEFSLKEMYLKMSSSAKWRSFGLSLNVLIWRHEIYTKIYLQASVGGCWGCHEWNDTWECDLK